MLKSVRFGATSLLIVAALAAQTAPVGAAPIGDSNEYSGGTEYAPPSDWNPCGDTAIDPAYSELSFDPTGLSQDDEQQVQDWSDERRTFKFPVILFGPGGPKIDYVTRSAYFRNTDKVTTYDLEAVERATDQVNEIIESGNITDPSQIEAINKLVWQIFERDGGMARQISDAEEFNATYEPTRRQFDATCTVPPNEVEAFLEENGAGTPTSVTAATFWVTIATPESIVSYLLAEVLTNLGSPIVSFDFVDPETGWLFAKIPNRLFVGNINSVNVSDTVEGLDENGNRISVSAFVQANPTGIEFQHVQSGVLDGGDPDAPTIRCSWAQASSNGCDFEYYNSSSIAPDKTFITTTTVNWTITTSAGSFGHTTTNSEPVQVAEWYVTSCPNDGCD